jgi:hypothetical protein
MGLNLRRERFDDWVWALGPEEHRAEKRREFLDRLERHVGQKIDTEAWVVEDDVSPKVGSYTSYGIFYDCLRYVTLGDYEAELEADDDLEREALEEFRKAIEPASLKIPYAGHFIETEVSDTLFIPLLFDAPFAEDGSYVASLPGAVIALEAFARGLGFDLNQDAEPEFESGRWLPVSTACNIARILYGFFTAKRNACVAFV